MDSSKVRGYLLSKYEEVQSDRTLGGHLFRETRFCISMTLIGLFAGFSYAMVLGYRMYLLIFCLLICAIVVGSASIIMGIRCKITDRMPRPETMIKLRIIVITVVVIYMMASYAFVIYTGGTTGAVIRGFTNYQRIKYAVIAATLLAPPFAYISAANICDAYLINKYCPDLKDYNLKSDSKK